MYSSSPSPGREAGGAPGDKDERVSNGAGDESAKETAGEFDEDHAQPAYYSTSPLEVIIGEDDRVQITNTRAFPWRAICSLRIRAGNGTSWIGTGWLVAPRTVITAGHCVFMRDQGGWARSIEVIPGKDGAEMPFGSVVATRFASVVGWKRDGDREYDYGTILLPAGQALGARVGHFGFADYDDAALGGAQLNLSGYPGDKGMGATQWWHARKTKSVSARVIEYEIDTVGGQSGAPVWRVVGSARHAVGIHTNGLASGNSATRIQANVYDNITAWAREGA
jgi:V8-like Glu-specific endopeptidase